MIVSGKHLKIGFIGYGRYAYSLIKGMVESNYQKENLYFQKIKKADINKLPGEVKKRVWDNYQKAKKDIGLADNFIELQELPIVSDVLIISLSVADVNRIMTSFNTQ